MSKWNQESPKFKESMTLPEQALPVNIDVTVQNATGTLSSSPCGS